MLTCPEERVGSIYPRKSMFEASQSKSETKVVKLDIVRVGGLSGFLLLLQFPMVMAQ